MPLPTDYTHLRYWARPIVDRAGNINLVIVEPYRPGSSATVDGHVILVQLPMSANDLRVEADGVRRTNRGYKDELTQIVYGDTP